MHNLVWSIVPGIIFCGFGLLIKSFSPAIHDDNVYIAVVVIFSVANCCFVYFALQFFDNLKKRRNRLRNCTDHCTNS